MIKRTKLPTATREKLEKVADRVSALPELEALWLFGSYARGEETPLSDMDFAYLTMSTSRGSWAADPADMRVYRELSRFLGTDEITLIDLAGSPPVLAFRVLHGGKLLFCRNPERVAEVTERVLMLYPEVRALVREQLESEAGGKMEIDREKVLSQLRLLEGDLQRLREKATMSEEAYLANSDAQDVVFRRFQTAIESCLNIGNHLIARLRLRPVEDYASVFTVLGEEGILSRELAARMVDLARFRNLLVHLYWRVDHRAVFRRMRERINTLEEFQNGMRDFLAAR